MLRNSLESKEAPNLGHSNMPIEPLRCKVCGGLLDDRLKCQHCGTLHERVENRLEIIRVCPKHLIGYSASECPKCVEEYQALMLYNQEQAKLSFEREEALRKERETLEKERLRKIEQARLKHEQWKKSSYPKLKRISVVAVMCLIIGIAGICLSTENFIAHDVNAVPYSSTSYVPPVIPSPTPTPTPITTPSPITILNDNNVNINLVYENNQGISIAPSYFYETEGVQETFVVSIFLGGTIDSNDSNLLWTDGNSYNGFSKSDVISFSRLNSSDSYCVVISFIIPDGGVFLYLTLRLMHHLRLIIFQHLHNWIFWLMERQHHHNQRRNPQEHMLLTRQYSMKRTLSIKQ